MILKSEMKKTVEILQKKIYLGWMHQVGNFVPMFLFVEGTNRYYLEYEINENVSISEVPCSIYSKLKAELNLGKVKRVYDDSIIIKDIYSFVKVCLILAKKYSEEEFYSIVDKIYDEMASSELFKENSHISLYEVQNYEAYILGEIANNFQNAVNPYGNRRALIKRPSSFLTKVVVNFENEKSVDEGEIVKLLSRNDNVIAEVYKKGIGWDYASKIYLDSEKTESIEVHYRFSPVAKQKLLFSSKHVINGAFTEVGIDFSTGSVFTTDVDANLKDTFNILIDETNKSVVEVNYKITRNLAHILYIV